jgi:hypothetical protein
MLIEQIIINSNRFIVFINIMIVSGQFLVAVGEGGGSFRSARLFSLRSGRIHKRH